MSKYQEMCQAAQDARRAFQEYQHRSWGNLSAIVGGLTTACGVPDEKIVLLRWNEEYGELRRYLPHEEGRQYTIPGATVHDVEDDFWYLGLLIWLTQIDFITFGIGIAERGGKTAFRIGQAKPENVDLSDEEQLAKVCEGIANDIVDVYREPRGEVARTFGFVMGG